jgi:hypothetical protein
MRTYEEIKKWLRSMKFDWIPKSLAENPTAKVGEINWI